MTYNTFDSEQEAIDAQAYDFSKWLESHPGAAYQASTSCWDSVAYSDEHEVWYYRSCPDSDVTYNTMSWNNSIIGEV